MKDCHVISTPCGRHNWRSTSRESTGSSVLSRKFGFHGRHGSAVSPSGWSRDVLVPFCSIFLLRGAPGNYAKSPVGESIWTQLLVVQNGRHYNMLMECHFAQPGRGTKGSYESSQRSGERHRLERINSRMNRNSLGRRSYSFAKSFSCAAISNFQSSRSTDMSS